MCIARGGMDLENLGQTRFLDYTMTPATVTVRTRIGINVRLAFGSEASSGCEEV